MTLNTPQAQALIKCIECNSLVESLWELVRIPSPTGKERKAALRFAEMLESAGAVVEIDETLHDSPNIIGRLKGQGDGPILQLAGHIDHIDMPHAEPKLESDIISGRGAADMKNGLAGILEIVRILSDNDCNFPGEILVTVYGLHEAPDGDSSGLFNLLGKNVKGDAAIVFEGPDDGAVVMANGMSIWNLNLRNDAPACHELSATPNRTDLLEAVTSTVNVLKQKNKTLQEEQNPFPLLADESLFIGQVHYGDFYNRVPNKAFMQGTRRWHPKKTFEQVKGELDSLIKNISIPKSIKIEQSWTYVGDSYKVDPEEKIVKSFQKAFETIQQRSCPLKGHSSITDTCRLVSTGKVPAVLCGFGTETGHADYEFVRTGQLERSCAVALLTVLNYLTGTVS